MNGDLGHSRKLPLSRVLELVRGQGITAFVQEGADVFGVCARSIESALSDLDWGGFIKREPGDAGDRRRRVVTLTATGRRALEDPLVAAELLSLPKRRRERSGPQPLPTDEALSRASFGQWRREMWR